MKKYLSRQYFTWKTFSWKAFSWKAFSWKALSRFGAYALFWSWNLIFLAFMLFGFAPQILPEVLNAVRTGLIPTQFLIYGIILASIPAIAVIIGATVLRKQPGQLLMLGYGVEGPLMIILGARFFLIRQTTPATIMLLTVAGLALLTYLWQILDRRIDERRAGWGMVRVVGVSLLLMLGVYVSVWLAFYVIPLGVAIVRGIIEAIPELLEALRDLPTILRAMWAEFRLTPLMALPFFILGALLFGYTATLLVVMPIAVPTLYIRAWRRGIQTVGARTSWAAAMVISIVAILACVSVFIVTNRQPQQDAFALLESPPATRAEASALLAQQEAIRAGLLNSYLASFRYASAVGDVTHISEIYRDTFELSVEQAAGIQSFYEQWARPLLYTPVSATAQEITVDRWRGAPDPRRVEAAEAAELYEAFFDQPINDGERTIVVDAARTTWLGDQALEAWQAVDHREVYLRQQEVTVTDHGAWADVELYEVYENKTAINQEVVYYFNLPESAVITGIWLGESANRDERFVYQVAPRGAAQAVYRNEVRRNVDPALVEQIGPRQYRLRVFPVLPLTQRWENDDRSVMGGRTSIEAAPPLHMWLTWRVLADENGFALPQLAERRNVYWDGNSTRLLNGEPRVMSDVMLADDASWLPTYAPMAEPFQRQAQRVDFPGGRSVLLQPTSAEDLPAVPNDVHFAVVLDRSRSMAAIADEVDVALTRLREFTNVDSPVDLYLTASPFRGEDPSVVTLADFAVDSILYYGGQNSAQLLAQFDELQSGQSYDAIFVLTDGTGYALGETDVPVPQPAAPVWMVHLSGDFPLGYDDPTLEAIQASGGGVTGNIADALTRLAVSLASQTQAESATPADILDGYTWLSLSTTEAAELAPNAVIHAPSDDFAALAARRLILAEMQRLRGDLQDPEILDGLHAIALEHDIITPYSSMIVLINQRQQELLDKLSEGDDRFLRETEAVGETVPETAPLTGVPEPEEWLLIAIVTGLLAWYVYNSRERLLPQMAQLRIR